MFKECFVRVLADAGQTGVLKQVGEISVDGTKEAATASKHAAASCQRAGAMIAQLEQEVGELLAKAEAADAVPLADGLSIPAAITRRRERQEVLAEARRVIEERFAERHREEQAGYEAKCQERTARRAAGERVGGRDPHPPAATPGPQEQVNFTDPESRIMKAGNGEHFVQGYHAQLAVDTEGSLLVVGERVTAHPNDQQELVPTVQAVEPAVRQVSAVLADSGFYREQAVPRSRRITGRRWMRQWRRAVITGR